MVESSTVQRKKSGLVALQAGQVLFHENDIAKSLYIIQKGQLRLYKPKGRGFVELAVLRAGEVIGEMAYFDSGSNKRSCSASAIVETEIIEISFNALEKAMTGLNPWFKTIVNTLAERLRKTNDKVKALENNSLGFGQGGKVADYKFFHMIDIVRMFSLFFLAFKAVGEPKDGKYFVHQSVIKLYAIDIFNVMEVKFEEFVKLLKEENIIRVEMDSENLPRIYVTDKINKLKEMAAFFNKERVSDDKKRLKISNKCERILARIDLQINAKQLAGDKVEVNLSVIFKDFRDKNVPILEEDLADAIEAGLCEDILVGSNNELTTMLNLPLFKRLFPCIVMMNAVNRINESKSGSGY